MWKQQLRVRIQHVEGGADRERDHHKHASNNQAPPLLHRSLQRLIQNRQNPRVLPVTSTCARVCARGRRQQRERGDALGAAEHCDAEGDEEEEGGGDDEETGGFENVLKG